jgi:hypothetical protein
MCVCDQAKANVEMELKVLQTKFDQEVTAARQRVKSESEKKDPTVIDSNDLKLELEQEQANRKKAEAQLLDADKKVNELKVELTRLQQKNDMLKAEQQSEQEKVTN